MSKQPIKTVKDFVTAIGRSKFEGELGHKPQVVSRAISEGIMPAHWYIAARDLAKRCGVDAPECLFRWHHGRTDMGSQNANVKASHRAGSQDGGTA